MTRRCSHCSNNGHNSRTCPARGGGVRLFGVRLTDGVGTMKKSASMGCLSSAAALSTVGASPSADPAGDHPDAAAAASGYASDDPAHSSCSSVSRKKEPRASIPSINSITMVPTFYPAFIPVPIPIWPPNLGIMMKEEEMSGTHEVLKPVPIVPKESLNVEEVVGMSKLSIGDGHDSCTDPSELSLKLVGSSMSSPSSFHVNSSVVLPDLNQSNGSPIHAV
ncbi:hypothetical protein GW17_00040954 [Ensete ventricosum]|nr:hypothetical protein GW17_00040954 [Ensete ventricosum]